MSKPSTRKYRIALRALERIAQEGAEAKRRGLCGLSKPCCQGFDEIARQALDEIGQVNVPVTKQVSLLGDTDL